MFLLVSYQTVLSNKNMCLQDADARVIGGKRGSHAAAGPGPTETADQADTPTHLGMATPPLQRGAPGKLAIDSGALNKPGTVQVHLLTCQVDAITICCNVCHLLVCT